MTAFCFAAAERGKGAGCNVNSSLPNLQGMPCGQDSSNFSNVFEMPTPRGAVTDGGFRTARLSGPTKRYDPGWTQELKLVGESNRTTAVNHILWRILEPVFVRGDGAFDCMDQEGALGDQIVPSQSRRCLDELAQVIFGVIGRALLQLCGRQGCLGQVVQRRRTEERPPFWAPGSAVGC